MSITPICGYKDSQGKFWETEKEAFIANKKYALEALRTQLERLLDKVSKNVNDEFQKKAETYPYHRRLLTYYYKEGPEIFREAIEYVIANPDTISKISDLGKEIEQLRKEATQVEKTYANQLVTTKSKWWKFWSNN